jgi:hypothetical protein
MLFENHIPYYGEPANVFCDYHRCDLCGENIDPEFGFCMTRNCHGIPTVVREAQPLYGESANVFGRSILPSSSPAPAHTAALSVLAQNHITEPHQPNHLSTASFIDQQITPDEAAKCATCGGDKCLNFLCLTSVRKVPVPALEPALK